MLKTKEDRLRIRELLNNDEELKKLDDWCKEIAKQKTIEELVYLAEHYNDTEEEKQRLRQLPREELEQIAANKLLSGRYMHLRYLADKPSWEERQASLKEDYDRWGDGWAHKLECRHCKHIFYARYPLARYCTDDCKIEAFKKVRKEKKEKIRRHRICLYCSKEFSSTRTHTKYCSESHRVLACHARKKGCKLKGEEDSKAMDEALASGFVLIRDKELVEKERKETAARLFAAQMDALRDGHY
jgi:hypothetical protein